MTRLIIIISILFAILIADTNEKPEYKTYIVPKESKIIYPDGSIFRATYNMWLLEYKYGIGLRRDAELWIKNQPVYEEKIKNRDERIINLQYMLTNRIMKSDNLEAINKYNMDYMKNLRSVFGSPENKFRIEDMKFGFGFIIGCITTIGIGFAVGYGLKKGK